MKSKKMCYYQYFGGYAVGKKVIRPGQKQKYNCPECITNGENRKCHYYVEIVVCELELRERDK